MCGWVSGGKRGVRRCMCGWVSGWKRGVRQCMCGWVSGGKHGVRRCMCGWGSRGKRGVRRSIGGCGGNMEAWCMSVYLWSGKRGVHQVSYDVEIWKPPSCRSVC